MKFQNKECCFLCWRKPCAPLFFILVFGIANCHTIQRIKECGVSCSQGFPCKNKQLDDSFNFFCRSAPKDLPKNVLENMKISTVMKCTPSSRCSLHLNVNGTVIFHGHVRGVEVCALSLGSQHTQCMNIRFPRQKQKYYQQKIHVQANCLEVDVSEHVYVTMKTIPDYCKVHLEEHYYVEDCHNKDVGKHIRSCISGKLDYMVNEGKKFITVHVSNILEDLDYNVRLCRKRFICHDVGAHAVIKKEDANKSVTLEYSEILPCLCIEGWSAMPDARRTRLCPFKNDISILWDSITYDPKRQVLTWNPLCPVNAEVHLCWMPEHNDRCLRITNSLSDEHDKVSYSRVDTQPSLCINFTTDAGSWVRCPFASGSFPAWMMETHLINEIIQIRLMSQTKAKFSVSICNQTNFNSCEKLQSYTLDHGGTLDNVTLNLSQKICGPNICIQCLRVDVNYTFPVQSCGIPCMLQDSMPNQGSSLQMLVVVAIILALTTIFTWTGYLTFQGSKRGPQKTIGIAATDGVEEQKD
ncbi:interleukin-17 receptor E-like protein isoform X2 [Hyperolius riggenbachi]|uniref:interleukin-17 receptor E-like protein isoform X2 n=1 Tax=Hyperolius riggenbachi TaxID=752182 RepID=UPI0035A34287